MSDPNPISKIDTQGMSGPSLSPEEAAKRGPVEHKPMEVRPRRLFTPQYAKEMKILINEVLDEREYKKKMAGAYDVGGYELPPSYFDTDQFKYRIREAEPPYQDWSQP